MNIGRRGFFGAAAAGAVAGPRALSKMADMAGKGARYSALGGAAQACETVGPMQKSGDFSGYRKAAEALFGKQKPLNMAAEEQRLMRLHSMSDAARNSFLRAKEREMHKTLGDLREQFGLADHWLSRGNWWENF